MRRVYSKFGRHLVLPSATFVPNFVSFAAAIAELAHGEKSRTQSLTQSLSHSPSLFDAQGIEVFASEKIKFKEHTRVVIQINSN